MATLNARKFHSRGFSEPCDSLSFAGTCTLAVENPTER